MDKITLPGPFGVLRLTMDSDDQWLTDTDIDDSSEFSDSGSDSSDDCNSGESDTWAVTVVLPIVLPVVLPIFRSKKRL